MNIGYASKTAGIPNEKFKTVRLKNVTDEKLIELIDHNLKNLIRIMDYNIENKVRMFRISSDIIPFGSHDINILNWWELFSDQLELIGKKALENDIRLSMHPGQYTVLNSPDEEVVGRAIEDLKYHALFLDALKIDNSHKIILHIGGVYGNKEAAMERFIQNYQKLDKNIKKRLIIENDDRQYTMSEVLYIAKEIDIPVVFDNLHHECNPDESKNEIEWLLEARKTWNSQDGRQKIHYSQQDPDKRKGAHTRTIDLKEFNEFYQRIPTQDLDIMFEVKDKNLSALKGIHLLKPSKIKSLDKEWNRYKYLVLEHSSTIYDNICQLLKDKENYPVLEFYGLIDEALSREVTNEYAINAAEAIWGDISQLANESVRKQFFKEIDKIEQGGSNRAIKRLLWKLVQEKEDSYLMDSLYFDEIY